MTNQICFKFFIVVVFSFVFCIQFPALSSQRDDRAIIPDNPRYSPSNQCDLERSACVLQKANELGEFSSQSGGPNCFNLVLKISGLLPALRHSTSSELEFYLRSPLCRKRRPHEATPGDIGVVETQDNKGWGPSHAFIEIGNGMVYEKGGHPKEAPYRLLSKKSALSGYFVKSMGSLPSRVSYYSCQSLDYFVAKQKVSEELISELRRISVVENSLQDSLLKGLPPSLKVMSGLFESAANLKKVAKNREQGSNSENFLVKALAFRIDSIGRQLRLYTDIDASPEKIQMGKQLHESAMDLLK